MDLKSTWIASNEKLFFRSNLGRHRRWQLASFFLCFFSFVDVKVRRNKLRFLIVGAIALLGSIHVISLMASCHSNPAVTLADASQGELPWREVPGYLAAQIVGAFAAAGPRKSPE